MKKGKVFFLIEEIVEAGFFLILAITIGALALGYQVLWFEPVKPVATLELVLCLYCLAMTVLHLYNILFTERVKKSDIVENRR